MKKIIILITVLILMFLAYLIILEIPKNYQLTYNLKDFKITESFLKYEKKYLFEVSYNNTNYPLLINKKYTAKRKLISSITTKEEQESTCLNIKIEDITYYICSNDNKLKSLNAMSPSFLKKNYNIYNNKANETNTFNNIKIYNSNHRYLIWNYKGYYIISNQKNIILDIFKKDNYKNFLSYQTDRYLVFPNYDQDYNFNELYVYDNEDNKLHKIKLEEEISYDLYYLGTYKDKVYFIDKKNKNEYELNLHKQKIKLISSNNTGAFYNGKKLINISLTKLINNETKFPINNIYNYKLDKNELYLYINNYKIKITDLNVKKIIYINNDEVYYLSDNKLYFYKYNNNEEILLSYDEWNFNYNNHIFIFN